MAKSKTNVGQLIEETMTVRKMSQYELGKRIFGVASVGASMLSQVRHGKRPLSPRGIVKLAAIANVSVKDLVNAMASDYREQLSARIKKYCKTK